MATNHWSLSILSHYYLNFILICQLFWLKNDLIFKFSRARFIEILNIFELIKIIFIFQFKYSSKRFDRWKSVQKFVILKNGFIQIKETNCNFLGIFFSFFIFQIINKSIEVNNKMINQKVFKKRIQRTINS